MSDENSSRTVDLNTLFISEFGMFDFSSRLSNQQILRNKLNLESKIDKVFILKEASQSAKKFAETQTIRSLKKILSDEEVLITLINAELKK